MKHKNIGDSFDSFLEDEGILEEVEEVAIKRVIAFQLKEEGQLKFPGIRPGFGHLSGKKRKRKLISSW